MALLPLRALQQLRAQAAARREWFNDPASESTDGPFDATWYEAIAVEREIDGDPAEALVDAALLLDPSVLAPGSQDD